MHVQHLKNTFRLQSTFLRAIPLGCDQENVSKGKPQTSWVKRSANEEAKSRQFSGLNLQMGTIRIQIWELKQSLFISFHCCILVQPRSCASESSFGKCASSPACWSPAAKDEPQPSSRCSRAGSRETFSHRCSMHWKTRD